MWEKFLNLLIGEFQAPKKVKKKLKKPLTPYQRHVIILEWREKRRRFKEMQK